MRKYLKYIFYGFILLFLFHFETLYIGPVKISHLWKGLVLIFLLIGIVRKKTKLFIYKPFLWIAILQLINVELINNPFNAVVNFATILLLPVMGIYILQFNPIQLKKAIIFFSSFIILAFLPYQLNILSSIEEGYNLSAFGGTSGLIGPFQNPHGASISLASALIVILYYWFEGGFNKIYLTILFLFGFYFLINTYVRTGLAMFAIGSLPILYYFGKKKASTFFRLILLGIFLIIIATNWILSNEVLMNRITGQTQYQSEDSIEAIGSGRGGIYIASVQIFIESNPFEKIFGMGQTEQMSRIQQKINMRIGSHNGFLDTLLQNGILGFFILIAYSFKFYRLKKWDNFELKALIKSLFWAFLIMTFVQGYEWISANLICMLAISLVYQNKIQNLNEERYSINRAL